MRIKRIGGVNRAFPHARMAVDGNSIFLKVVSDWASNSSSRAFAFANDAYFTAAA
jgi:hypothetical protein